MGISRIDLADAGSPDKLVTLILKLEPGLAPPIPIRDLCRQLDIIEICARNIEGFEGGLLTDVDRSNGIILHREDRSEKRTRFTIGHELGHFLMPLHVPDEQGRFLCSAKDFATLSAKEGDRRTKMEFEANRFASLILIPPPILRKCPSFNREADLRCLSKLADDFCVSKDVMARSYADHHDQDIALVMVKDKIVLRVYRNQRKFPFITTNLKAAVPVGSMLHKRTHEAGLVSDHLPCVLENWIDTPRGAITPELFEQLMWQRNGYAMILLTLVRPDEDEEELDEQIARNWQIGFRR